MVSAGVQRITPGRWCDGTSDSLPARSHGLEENGNGRPQPVSQDCKVVLR